MSEINWLKQQPLYGCCSCHTEYSFPADDLRVAQNRTYCQLCWDDIGHEIEPEKEWYDLPAFMPELEQENAELKAERDKYREALEVAKSIIKSTALEDIDVGMALQAIDLELQEKSDEADT